MIKYVGFKVKSEAHFRELYAKLVALGYSQSHSQNADRLLSIGSGFEVSNSAIVVDRYGDIMSIYKLNVRTRDFLLIKPSQSDIFREVADKLLK